MFKQGVLPVSYECEPTESGMTALAGLPAYLELAIVSGLTDSIQRHLGKYAKKEQGWSDTQIVMSLVLLNITGGDSVDDLRILEKDEGLVKVVRQLEFSGHPRKERREQKRRWRKERKRAFPSPSVVFRYLTSFINPAEETRRARGRAFIPAANERLQALRRLDWIAFVLNSHKHDQLAQRPVSPFGYSYEPIRQLQRLHTGILSNYLMVNDPVLDSFQPKAIAATSEDELKQILRDANERIARQHFGISLLQPMQYSLYQPWLKGYNGQFGSVCSAAGSPQLLFFYPARFWIEHGLKKSMRILGF